MGVERSWKVVLRWRWRGMRDICPLEASHLDRVGLDGIGHNNLKNILIVNNNNNEGHFFFCAFEASHLDQVGLGGIGTVTRAQLLWS